VFRAYVPFHSGEGLRIARIDLDPAAADFLLVHARHNVIIASAGGLVLLALSIYSLWSMRRAARLRERQLEIEQLARIGKMAAALAHEIRNPLGTIKGFVQLAGERVDAATKNLLRPAIVETERLERLVTDLLTYSRPPTPAPAPAEWDDVALRLEAHGRHLIGERPIALSISRSGFTWNTDAGLVEQALLNLLRNAIEAIPQNTPGEVRIEFEQRGADIVISVEDTGAGLSDNARTRIFEPFFTTKASGTGLGLAITRGLVSSLGGRLELHGRETGGTRAVMTFPQVAAIAAGAVN
jgi:signal transduction histidine kinase